MKSKFEIYRFLEKARTELRRRFSQSRVHAVERVWRNFNYFVGTSKIKAYSPKVGLAFKRYICGKDLKDDDLNLSSAEKCIRCSIRMLDSLHNTGTIPLYQHKNAYQFPPRFLKIAERFLVYRSTQVKPTSFRTSRRHLGHFCDFMVEHRIAQPRCLTPAHISAYCKTLAGYDNCTIHTYLCDLRVFLQYLREKRLHARDLSLVIPKFRLYQDVHIPTTWTPEEINRLLATVDRANPLGKRDYAMLIMVAVLSLRIGDLIMLKLENLDWREKRVNYIQEKDGSSQFLPITEEVGAALIDYLKNGRPNTNCRNVFVRHLSPIGPFSTHNSYWTVFLSYMTKAGLSQKSRTGMHSLRHSLASHMLQRKVSLPVISNILGHTHFRTTLGYLKVDIDQLRQCCLSFGAVEGQA